MVVGGCRSINAVWGVRSINTGCWRVQEYEVWGVHSINSGSWRVQEYQCSVGCAFYKHWLLEGAGVSMKCGCVL